MGSNVFTLRLIKEKCMIIHKAEISRNRKLNQQKTKLSKNLSTLISELMTTK